MDTTYNDYDKEPKNDLVGEVFGRQTVVSFAYHRITPGNPFGTPLWNVKCQCGTIRPVLQRELRRGKIKSCGCIQRNKTDHEVAVNRLYHYMIKGCERKYNKKVYRTIDVHLTKEQFENLIMQACHYCGHEGTERPIETSARSIIIKCNGIDRVDNESGYSIDNCVPCCETCNRGKRAQTYEQFQEYLNRVANFRR